MAAAVAILALALAPACGFGGYSAPALPGPEITSFTAAKPVITQGDGTSLTAVFRSGSGRVDQGVGAVESETPAPVQPAVTTTYTLTVTGNSILRKLAYDSGSGTGSASLFAGTPSEPGSSDGAPGTGAFRAPTGVAVPALAGGALFAVDTGNDTIRTLAADGTAGPWAGLPPAPGAADGQGGAAGLRHPQGVAMDSGGNLYVADTANHTIRKITPGGLVSTWAGQPGQGGYQDGPAARAMFSSPAGVAVAGGAGGVTVYVADTGNQVIRMIQGGQVATLAGTAGTAGAHDSSGPGVQDATFNLPSGLALDGRTVYVADTGNHTLRVLQGGQVTTLAGTAGQPGSVDGTGPTQLNGPVAIALDRAGNLFVANAGSSTVCLVSPAQAGAVTTIIGNATRSGNALPAPDPLPPLPATISPPGGLAVDLATGNIFITIDDAVVLADFQP